MGLISLPLQFLFAAPNILWNTRQTQQWPTVKIRPPECKSSGSPSIPCCSGTCPKLVPPYLWGALNVPVKKAFSPARGRRKVIPQTQWRSGWGLSSVPCLQACVFVCFFLQWSKRPKSNLSYKKQDSDGYKGSDQEQRSLLSLPHPIYVLHRKTKKQVHKTQQLKLQKSIHPRAVGGRKGKWKGNGTGRKSIQISPGTGLANARKELQKNLWSFQTHQCLKSILVAGRFCLTCTRDKNLDSSESRECGQGPWQGGPAFPGSGWRWTREELPQHPSHPTRPLRMAGDRLSGLRQPSVWQETGAARVIFLQKWSCSGPTAGRPSCGRVCCLRKPPRRRGATGKGCKARQTQPLRPASWEKPF